MTDKDWLQGLKEGDPVVVRSAGHYGFKRVDQFRPQKVSRILKTVIVLDDESRFRRADGTNKYRAELRAPTGDHELVELMRQAREERRRVDVEDVKRGLAGHGLSDEEAGKVLDLIAEMKEQR